MPTPVSTGEPALMAMGPTSVSVLPGSQERTVRPDNEEEVETESSSSDFRPKSMSSPDFLKTYRNNSTDWPALTDESEVEGDDDDDLDGTPAVAAAVEAVKAARDRSDSGSGSSLTRRKRCETVASTEHQ